jgi:hypothetical protein
LNDQIAKQKNLYKKNKNGIRNEKNKDWNYQTNNKEDNDVL